MTRKWAGGWEANILLFVQCRMTTMHITRGIGLLLMHREDDQNQTGDDDQDNDQVSVAEVAPGEVGLCFLSPGRQLCQFSIPTTGHCLLHLLRLCLSCLQ